MQLKPDVILDVFLLSLAGIPTTLYMVFAAFLLGSVFGFLMALAISNKVPVISPLFRIFISFMRGTPIIVQIFLVYHSLPSLLNVILTSMNSPLNIFDVNPITYAIVVFALSESAILAEAFRAALNGVEKGQLEAAQCAGLTRTQGYLHIVLPQAIAAAIPVLGNAVTDLIKTTSLAFSMGILDVTGIAKIEAAASLNYIDSYIAVFFVYLILVLVFENVFKLIEYRLNAHKKPRHSTRLSAR